LFNHLHRLGKTKDTSHLNGGSDSFLNSNELLREPLPELAFANPINPPEFLYTADAPGSFTSY
jgi:hypothetical protein